MKKLVLSFVIILYAVALKAQQKHFYMFSKMNGTVTLEDGSTTDFWGYGFYVPASPNRPSLPGPTLVVDEGDTVSIHFRNLSPEEHTIHLHGLDVDQANDGVPQTSFSVSFNDSTTYTFVATHTGSYLYHCHVATTLHLAMGMYGMIVVRNKPNPNQVFDSGPGFNKEYLFLASEMNRAWNNNAVSPGPFNLYVADYFMINGFSGSQLFLDSVNVINAQPNDSIVLRLANMGYGFVNYSFPAGLNAKVVMSDGRELPVAFSTDTLRIYPGERYEVVLKPTTMIVDFITVNYHNSINETYMGTNYIGVNVYTYSVGMQENNSANGLKIYPNPANELISVLNENPGTRELIIFSLDGKVVLKSRIAQGNNNIDISSLSNGMYLVKSGNTFSRFVIAR
ncbi:MAG TPA: multicopper oxidase domain-containing protein [Bacteroidia bacterium]|jgi:FtsP/CotA-like multicopper oxidase with cupredoxin domain